jgi:hypothetical protein
LYPFTRLIKQAVVIISSSMLPTADKILSNTILSRLAPYADENYLGKSASTAM